MDIKLITTPTATLNTWDQIAVMGKLGDLSDTQYRTLLALSAMLELLVDKGILTREELEEKSAQLEAGDSEPLKAISALFDPMG
ncbi:hypothetical protein SAMN05444162_2380 [Paenibacillaceae bacterium GAS479]|nr:hypothetical protein SAMN05444162_2380 [Paenibacillaceae bacterium GAS479]